MPIKYIGSNYPQDNSAVPKVDGKVISATTSDGVVRNIFTTPVATAPSGGNNGDIWVNY